MLNGLTYNTDTPVNLAHHHQIVVPVNYGIRTFVTRSKYGRKRRVLSKKLNPFFLLMDYSVKTGKVCTFVAKTMPISIINVIRMQYFYHCTNI